MPQFDVKAFPSQIFWLVVCFAVLYFLMAKFVLPSIGKTIESREHKIQADLDAVGVALARHIVTRLPESDEVPSASTLVPLRFAPRASHGRAALQAQRMTQAPLRDDERTQASTKATPVTPSSIVG